jgi:hypothetical protein
VELFEEIRQEYRFGVGTVRGVAKQLGVHRRMVRQAMASAIPPERKIGVRPHPKLEAVKEFIDEILKADQQAPRKQRHTAHLAADSRGTARGRVSRGIDGASLRVPPQAGVGHSGTRDVRAADLRLGPRSAGRLVRSLR